MALGALAILVAPKASPQIKKGGRSWDGRPFGTATANWWPA
jgi:hypothetical protein